MAKTARNSKYCQIIKTLNKEQVKHIPNVEVDLHKTALTTSIYNFKGINMDSNKSYRFEQRLSCLGSKLNVSESKEAKWGAGFS